MRAVNLIPADSKRGASGSKSWLPNAPAIALLGLLTVALAFVTIYVLSSNTVSERQAKIADTQLQLTGAQAQVAGLGNYTQLAQLAAARILTIRQIATARFDWYAALSDLSKVVPADTSLQSLVGTVSPDAGASGGSVGGSSAGAGSAIRGDIAAPAIELSGCTKTQSDVARLMSRLRLINGVTRVTLAQSQKQQGVQSGVSASSGGSSAEGCGQNAPTFDLVVFFQPVPGAASNAAGTAGVASATAGTATTTTTVPTASTATTTPAPGTTTTTTTQSATSSGAGSGGAQ